MILISSCSHVEYRSANNISVSWTAQASHLTHKSPQLFLAEEKIPFYFFGLVPAVRTVFIDKIAQEAGFSSVSRLSLYERASWSDVLYSVLTLGIYTPRTVTFQGLGIGL
jgi:hypothetical protein